MLSACYSDRMLSTMPAKKKKKTGDEIFLAIRDANVRLMSTSSRAELSNVMILSFVDNVAS